MEKLLLLSVGGTALKLGMVKFEEWPLNTELALCKPFPLLIVIQCPLFIFLVDVPASHVGPSAR